LYVLKRESIREFQRYLCNFSTKMAEHSTGFRGTLRDYFDITQQRSAGGKIKIINGSGFSGIILWKMELNRAHYH